LAVYDGNLIAALQFRDCTLRNGQCAVLEPDDCTDSPIATGAQNVPWIGKQSGKANCAGAFIDLAVGKIKGPDVGIGRAVSQNQLEGQIPGGLLPAASGREPPPPLQILRFTGGKKNLDRVNRGNGGNRTASRTHQSAYLQMSFSSNSVNGRDQARKAEIDPRVFYSGFIRLNLSFGRFYRGFGCEIVLDGIVQILLTGGLLFR